MLVTKLFLVHIDFQINIFLAMEASGDQQLFDFHILQNIFYVQKKKETCFLSELSI